MEIPTRANFKFTDLDEHMVYNSRDLFQQTRVGQLLWKLSISARDELYEASFAQKGSQTWSFGAKRARLGSLWKVFWKIFGSLWKAFWWFWTVLEQVEISMILGMPRDPEHQPIGG